MAKNFSVPLSDVMQEMTLEAIYLPDDPKTIRIESADINRPGLSLGGYNEYFDADRIQIMGYGECGYLRDLPEDVQRQRLDDFLSFHPTAVVVTRHLDVLPVLKEKCEKYGIPLLRSAESTSAFMAALIAHLNVQLAPRITRHGVLVEVHGEGILLTGDSGIGKSETAIELVKRGHRLIADDAVEIRRVSAKTLVGSAPENIRHFIELRGIGIVNVRRIFGIGSVKLTEKIDMVIHLEPWDSQKMYDRMGIESEQETILGITVPKMTIPVHPGRNLAIIIEVASMNNRQKRMGYNAGEELIKRLGMADDTASPDTRTDDWERY